MALSNQTDHLPKVKKVAAKKLKRIRPEFNHFVLLHPDFRWVSSRTKVLVNDDQIRIHSRTSLGAKLPLNLTIMIMEGDGLKDYLNIRASNLEQFDLALAHLRESMLPKEAIAC